MQQRLVRKLEFLAPFSPWSFELVTSDCLGRHAAGIGPFCLCRSRCLFASLYRSGPHTACSQGVSSIATIGWFVLPAISRISRFRLAAIGSTHPLAKCMQCQNESFHVFGGLNESSAKLSHAARIPQPSMKESSSHEFHEPGIRSQELSANKLSASCSHAGLAAMMAPARILSRAACMLLFKYTWNQLMEKPPYPPLQLSIQDEHNMQTRFLRIICSWSS